MTYLLHNRSWLTRLIPSLRQLVFPKEFRIAPLDWPPGLQETLHHLADILSIPAPHPSPPQPLPVEDLDNLRFLTDVATSLWRLRDKMLVSGTDQPREEVRRAYRHLESAWAALSQAGYEIRDHTGEFVPEGGIYALKTIAYQPTPGITREKVIETIKPSIFFRDKMIQMGEVIVGTPEVNQEKQKT